MTTFQAGSGRNGGGGGKNGGSAGVGGGYGGLGGQEEVDDSDDFGSVVTL
jgi:hypothetical protein